MLTHLSKGRVVNESKWGLSTPRQLSNINNNSKLVFHSSERALASTQKNFNKFCGVILEETKTKTKQHARL